MLASEDGVFSMELVSQLVGYLLNCAKSATHVKIIISLFSYRRALALFTPQTFSPLPCKDYRWMRHRGILEQRVLSWNDSPTEKENK